MILYSSKVNDFVNDVNNNKISYILENIKKKNCMKEQHYQKNNHGKIL